MRWSDPFERLFVGQRFESDKRTVRDTDVAVFSALTGDWHPQHCDPEWAARSPFGEIAALRPIDEHSGLVDFAWQIRNQDGALVARANVQVLWRTELVPAAV